METITASLMWIPCHIGHGRTHIFVLVVCGVRDAFCIISETITVSLMWITRHISRGRTHIFVVVICGVRDSFCIETITASSSLTWIPRHVGRGRTHIVAVVVCGVCGTFSFIHRVCDSFCAPGNNRCRRIFDVVVRRVPGASV